MAVFLTTLAKHQDFQVGLSAAYRFPAKETPTFKAGLRLVHGHVVHRLQTDSSVLQKQDIKFSDIRPQGPLKVTP